MLKLGSFISLAHAPKLDWNCRKCWAGRNGTDITSMKLGHGLGLDGLLEVFVVSAVLRSIQNLHESGGYRIKAWPPCQRDPVGTLLEPP